MEQAVKEEPVSTEPVKTGMTSEEAAKMIIQKMDSTDPLSRAINQSLKQ